MKKRFIYVVCIFICSNVYPSAAGNTKKLEESTKTDPKAAKEPLGLTEVKRQLNGLKDLAQWPARKEVIRNALAYRINCLHVASWGNRTVLEDAIFNDDLDWLTDYKPGRFYKFPGCAYAYLLE